MEVEGQRGAHNFCCAAVFDRQTFYVAITNLLCASQSSAIHYSGQRTEPYLRDVPFIMAPTFEHLREEDLDDDDYDEDELDFSDLREKLEVQLESGYDTFVVIDGLPEVNEEQKPKLVKFLLKKLNTVGKTREDLIYMPMGEDGKSMR
jgi:hypothetical protein